MAVESLAGPAKPVRAVNAMCAFGAAARRGRLLSVADVIRVTSFDVSYPIDRTRMGLSDAEDRRSSRLLKDLRTQGLRYEFRTRNQTQADYEGYYPLGLSEPPQPGADGTWGTWQKWIWLLWAGAKRLPVTEVCRVTRYSRRDLAHVLRSMSLCGLGTLPHELLDARIEGGLVIIEGPNPYAEVPSARASDHRGAAGHRGRA